MNQRIDQRVNQRVNQREQNAHAIPCPIGIGSRMAELAFDANVACVRRAAGHSWRVFSG